MCRMSKVAKGTVLKLLADLGAACALYHDEYVRHLNVRRVQADEIWAFVHAKQKNVPADHKGEWGYGDGWTWTALCRDIHAVVAGAARDTVAARYFMEDVASRLAHRVQLTTDGHRPYIAAVEAAFGSEVDYSVLNKVYS